MANAPKTIVPSRFQVPRLGFGAGASVRTKPSARSIRLSSPLAKNAIDRLSGDQNGLSPKSVPGSG